MEKKNSFLLYTEYMEHVDLLDMEQRGELFTAILMYAAGKEIPELSGMVKMAFSFIKIRMDRDAAEYEKTTLARAAAGRKGGRPRNEVVFEKQDETKKANGFLEKQTKANENNEKQMKAKKPDTDIDTESDIDIDTEKEKEKQILCDARTMFEHLWDKYPLKRGKGQVSDNQKKRLLAIGEAKLVKAIERYSLELQQDVSWRKPQNGSTFFNSGYVDYLDEEWERSHPEQQDCTIHPVEEQGISTEKEESAVDYGWED